MLPIYYYAGHEKGIIYRWCMRRIHLIVAMARFAQHLVLIVCVIARMYAISFSLCVWLAMTFCVVLIWYVVIMSSRHNASVPLRGRGQNQQLNELVKFEMWDEIAEMFAFGAAYYRPNLGQRKDKHEQDIYEKLEEYALRFGTSQYITEFMHPKNDVDRDREILIEFVDETHN